MGIDESIIMALPELKKVWDSRGNALEVISEKDGMYYCIPSGYEKFLLRKDEVYLSKEEGMYQKFLDSESPVQNYKGSKYYKYYRERARKENPERLI